MGYTWEVTAIRWHDWLEMWVPIKIKTTDDAVHLHRESLIRDKDVYNVRVKKI